MRQHLTYDSYERTQKIRQKHSASAHIGHSAEAQLAGLITSGCVTSHQIGRESNIQQPMCEADPWSLCPLVSPEDTRCTSVTLQCIYKVVL